MSEEKKTSFTPEEALDIQESLVGFTIPDFGFLQAFSANLMVILGEAAQSNCECAGCAGIRHAMNNLPDTLPGLDEHYGG